MPVTTSRFECAECGTADPDRNALLENRKRHRITCPIHRLEPVQIIEVTLVHHSRCADPTRLGCNCPTSWPRRPENLHLTHRRSGNCWFGVTVKDICDLHDEPRGECSQCGRCPACDAKN